MENFLPHDDKILEGLDEIVDVRNVPVAKSVRERSSILKAPKSCEDAALTEDMTKRKSFGLKRVSFADRFQVMELCTGNIYDVPGKNASESSLNSDVHSETKSEAAVLVESGNTSKVQITVTSSVHQLQMENKNYSYTQSSGKHKIISDCGSELEIKRSNLWEPQTSVMENVPPALNLNTSMWNMYSKYQQREEDKENVKFNFFEDSDNVLKSTCNETIFSKHLLETSKMVNQNSVQNTISPASNDPGKYGNFSQCEVSPIMSNMHEQDERLKNQEYLDPLKSVLENSPNYMELTCVANSAADNFQDTSESLPDGAKTQYFASDNMELTCQTKKIFIDASIESNENYSSDFPKNLFGKVEVNLASLCPDSRKNYIEGRKADKKMFKDGINARNRNCEFVQDEPNPYIDIDTSLHQNSALLTEDNQGLNTYDSADVEKKNTNHAEKTYYMELTCVGEDAWEHQTSDSENVPPALNLNTSMGNVYSKCQQREEDKENVKFSFFENSDNVLKNACNENIFSKHLLESGEMVNKNIIQKSISPANIDPVKYGNFSQSKTPPIVSHMQEKDKRLTHQEFIEPLKSISPNSPNYMELTCVTDSAADNFQDTSESSPDGAKTRCFTSDNMELTCQTKNVLIDASVESSENCSLDFPRFLGKVQANPANLCSDSPNNNIKGTDLDGNMCDDVINVRNVNYELLQDDPCLDTNSSLHQSGVLLAEDRQRSSICDFSDGEKKNKTFSDKTYHMELTCIDEDANTRALSSPAKFVSYSKTHHFTCDEMDFTCKTNVACSESVEEGGLDVCQSSAQTEEKCHAFPADDSTDFRNKQLNTSSKNKSTVAGCTDTNDHNHEIVLNSKSSGKNLNADKLGILYVIKKLRAKRDNSSQLSCSSSVLPEIFLSSKQPKPPASFSCKKVEFSKEVQNSIRQIDFYQKSISFVTEVETFNSSVAMEKNDFDKRSWNAVSQKFSDSMLHSPSYAKDIPQVFVKDDEKVSQKFEMCHSLEYNTLPDIRLETDSLLENDFVKNNSVSLTLSHNEFGYHASKAPSILDSSLAKINPPQEKKSVDLEIEHLYEDVSLDDVFIGDLKNSNVVDDKGSHSPSEFCPAASSVKGSEHIEVGPKSIQINKLQTQVSQSISKESQNFDSASRYLDQEIHYPKMEILSRSSKKAAEPSENICMSETKSHTKSVHLDVPDKIPKSVCVSVTDKQILDTTAVCKEQNEALHPCNLKHPNAEVFNSKGDNAIKPNEGSGVLCKSTEIQVFCDVIEIQRPVVMCSKSLKSEEILTKEAGEADNNLHHTKIAQSNKSIKSTGQMSSLPNHFLNTTNDPRSHRSSSEQQSLLPEHIFVPSSVSLNIKTNFDYSSQNPTENDAEFKLNSESDEVFTDQSDLSKCRTAIECPEPMKPTSGLMEVESSNKKKTVCVTKDERGECQQAEHNSGDKNQQPQELFTKKDDFKEKESNINIHSPRQCKSCQVISLENYELYAKINILREEIYDATENQEHLLYLKEMDGKQAVFELMRFSLFGRYLMFVPLHFDPPNALKSNAKITLKHLVAKPSQVDELGLLYFQSLKCFDLQNSPLNPEKFIKEIFSYADAAKVVKEFLKDVNLASISHQLKISFDQDLPRLEMRFLIEEPIFSVFHLTFSINLKNYPEEKIVPEIKHIEFDEIEKSTILNAIQKVEPGERYLYRMVQACDNCLI